MKKLNMYVLVDSKTGELLKLDLCNKSKAQRARRERNKQVGDPLRYMVAPGPDHPVYKRA